MAKSLNLSLGTNNIVLSIQEFLTLKGIMLVNIVEKHSGIFGLKSLLSEMSNIFSSRSPADVSIHEVVHTKDKAFNCDLCSAQFTQKASLKDHYNVHMKTFQCEHCKKSFGRQRYLDNHVKSCTGGVTKSSLRFKKEDLQPPQIHHEHPQYVQLNIAPDQNIQGISYLVTTEPPTIVP